MVRLGYCLTLYQQQGYITARLKILKHIINEEDRLKIWPVLFIDKAAFTISKFSWSKSIIENLVKVFLDKIDCLQYQSYLRNLYKKIKENAQKSSKYVNISH